MSNISEIIQKAQVVTALQQKGGAGKSTMISCLAAQLAGSGAKVLIIDTDPQQSCTEWAEEEELPNLDVMVRIPGSSGHPYR